jgi:hypothetical protein
MEVQQWQQEFELWAQVHFWTQAQSWVFLLCFFVFDLVVVLVELFSTMRVTQRELPKPKAKLGSFFLKHHCQTLMGVQ